MIRNSNNQNICLPISITYLNDKQTLSVERQLNHCLPSLAIGLELCHTTCVVKTQALMRKIESEMIQAIKDNKAWRSGNTEVTLGSDGVSYVFLHGNLIAEVDDTSITVYDGGWQSNTTKSRLNAICKAFCIDGEGIFQEKFEWFVHKCVEQQFGVGVAFEREKFVNGCVFA